MDFDRIMNELERRTEVLENRVLGLIGRPADNDSVLDQLNYFAKHYRQFIDSNAKNYPRFVELYNKYGNLLGQLEDNNDADLKSKTELVLAYEDDLLKYMEDIRLMAEKADKVLDSEKWPDLSSLQQGLDKLERINKEQHMKTQNLDGRIGDLIEIYKEIFVDFEQNQKTWNKKLEAHENADRRREDDE